MKYNVIIENEGCGVEHFDGLTKNQVRTRLYYQKNKEQISEQKKQRYLKKRGVDSVIPHIRRTEAEKKERLHEYNKKYYEERKVVISEKRKAKRLMNLHEKNKR